MWRQAWKPLAGLLVLLAGLFFKRGPGRKPDTTADDARKAVVTVETELEKERAKHERDVEVAGIQREADEAEAVIVDSSIDAIFERAKRRNELDGKG